MKGTRARGQGPGQDGANGNRGSQSSQNSTDRAVPGASQQPCGIGKLIARRVRGGPGG